jgi:hypothetical protein
MVKYMSVRVQLAFVCLLCTLLNSPSKAADRVSAASTQPDGKAIWAWAEKSGNEHAVFISRQAGEVWEEPQKISANEGVNVVPAVANTSGEDLMVVWTVFSGSQAQLHYRQLKGGHWSEEKEYYTGLSSNTAPSVCVDGTGKLWIVWAGFNGISDEIYYSTWNGTSFTTAKAITANDIPDIQPVLGINETTGTPWVQWLQFSQKGYMKYESTWDNSVWSKPLLVPDVDSSSTGDESTGTTPAVAMKKASIATKNASSGNQVSKKSITSDQLEIEIPEFVTNPESASIHIPGYAVQSLPVRSVDKRK